MLTLIYFILILVFSFISATLTKLNLVIFLVISLSINLPVLSSFILAFFSGIIFDLVKGQILGQSSIFFLIISLIISLYKPKFQQRHHFYAFTLTFLAFCLVNHLSYKNIFFFQSLITAVFIIHLNLLIWFFEEKMNESGRLKF